MRQRPRTLVIAAVLILCPALTLIAAADRFDRDDDHTDRTSNVQLGPRPFYLVEKMNPSRLKEELQRCADRPFFYQTHFSIGHRGGAPLQFPEHTKGARQNSLTISQINVL